MNFMAPRKTSPNIIALSDSQKSLLAAAMQEPSENARKTEGSRLTTDKPAADRTLVKSEELAFIL